MGPMSINEYYDMYTFEVEDYANEHCLPEEEALRELFETYLDRFYTE